MLTNLSARAPLQERRSKDPFAAVSCPALRTSLREVSAEWTPKWAIGPDGQSPIDPVLVRLALRLDGFIDRRESVNDDDLTEEYDSRLEVRLLEAIRRDLLEQWRRGDLPVEEDRVLAVLHAIDVHIDELLAGNAEDLEARLTEPDAFGLLAEVAHDLRSPLTSILFLSEAMRNGHSGSLGKQEQRQLGLIYSAALGLTGVVNDFMTIATEKTAGHLEEASTFSLAQTFSIVQEIVAPMAEAKQIALQLHVDCVDHRLGHSGPLGRVLLNLTTNAIKFTREGGSVEVVAETVAREAVEFSVLDTGPGIPPEQRAKLFQPFQKSHGRQGYFFAASGLGLCIVRRLLEKMDSELSVESEVGKGTRFSFVLNLPAPI